jgi:Ser/Thr protein kinase RdoA (MazF antagonist)
MKELITLTTEDATTALRSWATIIGEPATLGVDDAGRELWPVTAEDGRAYFLKRVSPWRNLPLADEARVLRWLAGHGIDVAEFLITDAAALFALVGDARFVLMPQLATDRLDAGETLAAGVAAGRAVAQLHRALQAYPWPANSYEERLSDSVSGALLLPDDVADDFAEQSEVIGAALRALPLQLVHGDLTPENVLMRRPAAVSGFIDFDHLPLAPRIWDIAKYLSRRMRLRWRDSSRSSTARTDHIRPFLHGYQQVCRLADAELRALPGTILAANVLEVSFGQEVASGRLQRRILPDHDEVLADAVEAARWQLANLAQVESIVRS